MREEEQEAAVETAAAAGADAEAEGEGEGEGEERGARACGISSSMYGSRRWEIRDHRVELFGCKNTSS